jgi:hypothetical protein
MRPFVGMRPPQAFCAKSGELHPRRPLTPSQACRALAPIETAARLIVLQRLAEF